MERSVSVEKAKDEAGPGGGIQTMTAILDEARALFAEKDITEPTPRRSAPGRWWPPAVLQLFRREKTGIPEVNPVITARFRTRSSPTARSKCFTASAQKRPQALMRELIRALYAAPTLSRSFTGDCAIRTATPCRAAFQGREAKRFRGPVRFWRRCLTARVSDVEAAVQVVVTAEEVIHRLRMFEHDIADRAGGRRA